MIIFKLHEIQKNPTRLLLHVEAEADTQNMQEIKRK